MSYNVGALPQVGVTWTNLAGQTKDSVTTLTVTAYTAANPLGIAVTPSAVTHVGATDSGQYVATIPVATAGTYVYRFATADVVTDQEESQFDVRPAGPRLLGLADAKRHVNATSTTNDDEMRDKLDAVTSMVERFLGYPVVVRTVTETVTVNGQTAVLGSAPVVALTSVATPQTGGATAPLVGDLTVESVTGIVYRTDGNWLASSSWGGQRLTFTYTAGFAVVPPDVREAARIIFAHLWTTQHNSGGGRATFGPAEELVAVPGMGFSLPRAAVELLEPLRVPSVA